MTYLERFIVDTRATEGTIAQALASGVNPDGLTWASQQLARDIAWVAEQRAAAVLDREEASSGAR